MERMQRQVVQRISTEARIVRGDESRVFTGPVPVSETGTGPVFVRVRGELS